MMVIVRNRRDMACKAIAVPCYGQLQVGKSMKKNLILSVVLWQIWIATGLAQPGWVLRGVVMDRESRQPLPGAVVAIDALGLGVFAGPEGQFSLTVDGADSVLISLEMLGYRKKLIPLNLVDKPSGPLELGRIGLEPVPLKAEEVNVVGRREELKDALRSVTVLEDEALFRNQGQTLGDLLRDLPGVSILQTGPSIAKPVIRGVHSDRILIVNAGVHMEGQQWGDEHAPAIDPFAQARVEVLRGAAGVEYGAGAIGGVVKVSPPEPENDPILRGAVVLNGFSNNRQASGSLRLSRGIMHFPGLAWQVQGSFRKAGDAFAPDYAINNTGFRENNASGGFSFQRGNAKTVLFASYFDTELGIFSGSHIGNVTDLERAIERGQPATIEPFSYDIDPPRQRVRHLLLSLKSDYRFSSLGNLHMQYGWQQNRRQEFDSHRGFSSNPPTDAAFDLELTTYSMDLALEHNPVGSVYGKIGISGSRQGNARQTSGYLIPNFRAYSGAGFWIENWSRGNLTLNAGLRYDYRWVNAFVEEGSAFTENNSDYNALSGATGFNYQVGRGWVLAGNLATAWRPPSINELYSDGVHHGSARYEIGNTNLNNERSNSVDMTIRHLDEKHSLEISLFHSRYDGFIFLFPEAEPILTIRGAFPAFSYRQADAVIQGLDGHFDWHVWPAYLFEVQTSLVFGDNLDTDEPLVWMPSNRLKLAHQFSFRQGGQVVHDLHAGFSTRIVFEQTRVPENADYAPPPPGYTLWDVEFGARVEVGRVPLELHLNINNVFNTAYRDYLSRFRYYADDPGRNVILRMQVPIGGGVSGDLHQ